MIPSEKSDATLAAKRQELMDKLLAKGDARAGRDDAIRPRATSAAVPLSFAQERLWFLDQFQPASPAYNIPMALRFTQPLNRDVLQRALDELVSRHESLRTTFTVADNRPVQVIEPQTSIRVRFTDLRGLSAEERAIETRRITAIENVHPFDLTQGPLLRAQLLRLGDAEDLLLVTLHHIVADGWSVGIFFQELNALYVAYLDGTQRRARSAPGRRFRQTSRRRRCDAA